MPLRDPTKRPCPKNHIHRHAATSTCYTSGCRCDPCTARATAYRAWRRTLPDAHLAYGDVPALVTRRRLQALRWVGYSPDALGRHLGLHKSLVWRWARAETVTRITEARVAKLYAELAFTPPQATNKSERISVHKTRAEARRRGWAGPLDWDDITDPNETPDTSVEADKPGWALRELDHLHSLGESASVALAALPHDPATLERQALRHHRNDIAAWIRSARKAA